jgi:hypothetical protein
LDTLSLHDAVPIWRGRKATGVVEESTHTTGEGDGDADGAEGRSGPRVVRFRAEDGTEAVVESWMGDIDGPLPVGSEVTVVYDPDDPSRAVPEVALAVRQAFGALFLLAGFLILLMVIAFVTGFF